MSEVSSPETAPKTLNEPVIEPHPGASADVSADVDSLESEGGGDAAGDAPAVVPAQTVVVVQPSPWRPAYLFLAIVSALVFLADFATKRWAVHTLEDKGFRLPPKEIIKGWFGFHLARNPGGAWGMFQDQPEKLRKPFFVLVSIIAVLVIVAMFRKLDRNQRALRWGLPLVLGGAIGNLIDRVRYGQVIDFIDVVYWKRKGMPMHWPTFNVADIAICIGVGLMAVDFLFPGTQKPQLTPPATTAPRAIT